MVVSLIKLDGIRVIEAVSTSYDTAFKPINTPSLLACSCSTSLDFVKAILALDTSALAKEESTPAIKPFLALITAVFLKITARSKFFCCDRVNRFAASRFK